MKKQEATRRLMRIAKQLTAKVVDGRYILDGFEEVSDKINGISNQILELKKTRDDYQDKREEIVSFAYDLAVAMRKEFLKAIELLEKKGFVVKFNDMSQYSDYPLICTCYLRQDNEDVGLIAFKVVLNIKNHINTPSLDIGFTYWKRQNNKFDNARIEGDKVLDNTFDKWKKFLAKVQKKFQS